MKEMISNPLDDTSNIQIDDQVNTAKNYGLYDCDRCTLVLITEFEAYKPQILLLRKDNYSYTFPDTSWKRGETNMVALKRIFRQQLDIDTDKYDLGFFAEDIDMFVDNRNLVFVVHYRIKAPINIGASQGNYVSYGWVGLKELGNMIKRKEIEDRSLISVINGVDRYGMW